MHVSEIRLSRDEIKKQICINLRRACLLLEMAPKNWDFSQSRRDQHITKIRDRVKSFSVFQSTAVKAIVHKKQNG